MSDREYFEQTATKATTEIIITMIQNNKILPTANATASEINESYYKELSKAYRTIFTQVLNGLSGK